KKDAEGIVNRGGILRSAAAVVLPGKSTETSSIHKFDRSLIKIGAAKGIDNLALSYTASASQIENLRSLCMEMSYFPRITAKIEIAAALKNLREISTAADELWFCRGDLAAHIPLKEIGLWQDSVIQAAKDARKPIIIAGQVFHHLTENENATRSEVVHLYYLQKQGANGIVLSDETAIGNNPQNAFAQVINLLK
ncbi:MAG: pyruvate kinase, partial [Calditrichia bacterium]